MSGLQFVKKVPKFLEILEKQHHVITPGRNPKFGDEEEFGNDNNDNEQPSTEPGQENHLPTKSTDKSDKAATESSDEDDKEFVSSLLSAEQRERERLECAAAENEQEKVIMKIRERTMMRITRDINAAHSASAAAAEDNNENNENNELDEDTVMMMMMQREGSDAEHGKHSTHWITPRETQEKKNR